MQRSKSSKPKKPPRSDCNAAGEEKRMIIKTLQNPNYFGENLKEKSFGDQESLTVIYDKSSYHISAAKCPRCGDCGELIEDGLVRCLYQCQKCGIFSKIKPKKRLHGLRRSIACQELTTALEILEVAGHKDQDAIDALNLYRGVVSHE